MGLITLSGASIVVATLTPFPTLAQEVAQVSGLASQTMTVLVVNSTTGNNTISDGTDRAPFRTITRALQVAQPNTVVLLAPGSYTAETGESFLIQLKPRVTIQGNSETRGEGIVIQGSGAFLCRTFARQNVTILGEDQAGLVRVTVTNSQPQGYGL